MTLKSALLRCGAVALIAAGTLALIPGSAAAQQGYHKRLGPNGEPVSPRAAPRRLGGSKDAALTGLRNVSYHSVMCAQNTTGGLDVQDATNCFFWFQSLLNGFQEVSPSSWSVNWGVPKTMWDTAKAKVPSLANATGGGWAYIDNENFEFDQLSAADGGLGLHHAGVQSTSDRGCKDHTYAIGAGNPLLATIDCPETWGTEGWKGARPVPLVVYQARFNANNNARDIFDFWKVPDADLDAAGVAANKTIGNFQTYGFTSDYSVDVLCGTSTFRNYGHIIPTTSQVVPGGCVGSDPANRRQGWPLGIEIRFDAFTFQLPALKDIAYFQLTLTNNSRRVYGVALDYDSLYMGLHEAWFANPNIQQNPEYWVVGQGTMYTNAGPFRPCDVAREVSDITCARWGGPGARIGFTQAAGALMMLKSPIGDQRYKLFTKTGSPFFNPAHPLRGDTITFNHGHLCGFRACSRNTIATNPATTPDHIQRGFGMTSSTESNVFGTRAPAAVTDQVYWHTFRNFAFPTKCVSSTNISPAGCGFSRWVPPGGWDYNKDGILDTLHIDGCNTNGCAALWGDTLPNGKYGAYSNVGGQMTSGPFKLKADSTVAIVYAVTTGQSDDSAGFIAQVAAAIDNYMNFYLAPDAAPKCRVTGVSRTAPGPTARPRITVAWDNSCFAGQWTDKFLDKQYTDLLAAPAGTALSRLRQLNPRLDDTLNFLRVNNLTALHVFKSCNDGNTWTTLNDCIRGSPATGGRFGDLGFLPIATFNTDDAAYATGLPTSYSDQIVGAGLTYTYDLVGESRGAVFNVINGDSVTVIGTDTVCAKNCRSEVLSLAPVLFNALSASTGDANVARAYLTVSSQAGAVLSKAVVTDSAGPMAATRLGITVTNDSLAAANYRLLFSDSARATQVEKRYKTTLLSVTTRLVLKVPPTPPAVLPDSVVVAGTNLGGLTPNGAVAAAPVVVNGATPDTTYTTRAYTWGAGPVMALTRRTTADVDPLLVSNTLTGAAATPGAFHTNANYPKFDIGVDNTVANAFDRAFFLTAGGDTVGPLVEPTTSWQSSLASQDQTNSSTQANGNYQVSWGAQPFGTGGVGGSDQFRLDFANPTASQTAINASIAARTAVGTGVVTDSAAAAVALSLAQASFIRDSLVAVKLPFTVTNLSYNRPVLVAMRKRPGKTVVVGSGADTLRVPVPDDAWVPGDTLFFIERIGTAPANPQRVTFRRAVIGCDPSKYVRLSCNPVYPQTRGAQAGSAYLGSSAGQVLRVQYNTPVTAASRFILQAVPPLRGLALAGNAGAVRAGLAAVRVVPNPYVMLSQYPGNVLMFTHLPPRGVLRIYTVSGQFVQQISWTEADLSGDGDLAWNLRSREGNQVAGGLFIYVLTATDASGTVIATRTDKFVIIR